MRAESLFQIYAIKGAEWWTGRRRKDRRVRRALSDAERCLELVGTCRDGSGKLVEGVLELDRKTAGVGIELTVERAVRTRGRLDMRCRMCVTGRAVGAAVLHAGRHGTRLQDDRQPCGDKRAEDAASPRCLMSPEYGQWFQSRLSFVTARAAYAIDRSKPRQSWLVPMSRILVPGSSTEVKLSGRVARQVIRTRCR